MQSVSAPIGASQLLLPTAFEKSCNRQQISKPSTLRFCNAGRWDEVALAARFSSRRIQRRLTSGVARSEARKGKRRVRAAAETAKPSVAKTSVATNTAPVTISLQKEAEFGFMYAVTGGGAALGDWNPAQAAVLDWSEGHIWSKTLDLPVNAAIEYKFILVNNNMEAVEWQPGENRSIATSAGASSVQGRWDEPLQGESEDSSMDSLMSEGDVSDEGTAGGGSKESAPAAAKEGRKGKKQVSGRNAVGKVEPSAEGSLAEADVAPAPTPAIEAAADAAADASPPFAPSKSSTPPPVQETSSGGGGNGLAIAGVSALLVLALLAAVITTHDSAPLIQKGDIKGAVSGAVNRVKAGGLSEVADSVGQHSSRILSSVSEKSTELSGHLEGLSKATGEGLGGLSKAAGDGLGGLSKATGEHIENLTKAAGETAAKAGRGRR